MSRLNAEISLLPKGIMGEANILKLEFVLSCLPLRSPSQMSFIELLAKFGDFDLVRMGKKNLKHGDPA
jgi:hypothetical protein